MIDKILNNIIKAMPNQFADILHYNKFQIIYDDNDFNTFQTQIKYRNLGNPLMLNISVYDNGNKDHLEENIYSNIKDAIRKFNKVGATGKIFIGYGYGGVMSRMSNSHEFRLICDVDHKKLVIWEE